MPALVLCLAAVAAAADPPKIELAGSHADETFRKEARGTFRHAWPVFCDLGGTTPEKDTAYRMFVYATREDYVAADKKLNQGKFANNGGFFSVNTGDSHLLMAPRTDTAYLARVPMTERMRALVVHEASHMFWRRHVKWYDGAPQWVLEGMAEYCAEREMGENAVQGVYFSTGMHALRRALEAGRLIALEDLLVLDYSSQPDAFLRDLFYRESWALVKWLVEERPAEWKKIIEGFTGVAAHQIPAARGRTMFQRVVGAPREVQEEWTKWIRGVKCGPWEMKYGDWRVDGMELEGAAYPKTGSAVFHRDELKGDVSVSAEIWVQELANGQADILLGCWDDRARNFVKVAFVTSGLTAILVLKEDQWERVAFSQSDPPVVEPETWTTVRVDLRGRTLTASCGDRELLTYEMADEDVRLDGRWGFGNFDSVVRFRNWKAGPK
ncbi:MAG: hypothetical protein HYY18_17860 [Planctomycetes bacterium]|nr:hypothetical protein [Planctomycetota bacterium]